MVSYERRGDVAVIKIDRGEKRNAVDYETSEELGRSWQEFEEDDASVGVLTGDGDAFSAGADLEKMDLKDSSEGYLGFTRTSVSKPTIAAIEGYCVAGGLEMALWCDLRVAGRDAVFGCFEREYGVPLVDGGTQRLPHIVGLGRALDMILTGREVSAMEALDWGLVNRVVDEGDALEKAVEIGSEIAGYPEKTVRTDRAAVYDGIGEGLDSGLKIEAWHGSRSLREAEKGAEKFRSDK